MNIRTEISREIALVGSLRSKRGRAAFFHLLVTASHRLLRRGRFAQLFGRTGPVKGRGIWRSDSYCQLRNDTVPEAENTTIGMTRGICPLDPRSSPWAPFSVTHDPQPDPSHRMLAPGCHGKSLELVWIP